MDYEDTFTERYSEPPRRVHCGDVSCQDQQVTMTVTILKTLIWIMELCGGGYLTKKCLFVCSEIQTNTKHPRQTFAEEQQQK